VAHRIRIPAFQHSTAPAASAFFISPGISVERHTPVFQTGIEGAIPSYPSISQANPISRDAKSRCRPGLHRPGCGAPLFLDCCWFVAGCESAAPGIIERWVAVRKERGPPSCRGPSGRPTGLQTLAVKSRLLPGENTVRIRGSPPISEWSDGVMECWITGRACRACLPINPSIQ
jgi:hypothetical protein